MFCYNRTEGGDFMPVGVLTNVCAVFIGTFIGGFINGYYGYYFRFCYWRTLSFI